MHFAAAKEICNWYLVRNLVDGWHWINEPGHCSFYARAENGKACLIDSGLGFSEEAGKLLMSALGVARFDVINTHAHCDHIGLNPAADRIFIGKHEWEKFIAQGEMNQAQHYLSLLQKEKAWPSPYRVPDCTWRPSKFIVDGDRILFGDLDLQIYETPGHTVGSTIICDPKNNLIFLGDLVYAGTLYLHLPDSSLACFIRSIELLISLIERSETPPVLLPSHNSIPLDVAFVYEVRATLSAIINGGLRPRDFIEGNLMFSPGVRFSNGRVRVIVRQDEYEAIRNASEP